MKNKIKVLIVGAELNPLAKAGGLADVMGSLPIALKKENINIAALIPFHEIIYKQKLVKKKKTFDFQVTFGNTKNLVHVWESYIPNIKIKLYLLENNKFLSQGGIYKNNKVWDPRIKKTAQEGR